MTSSTRHISAMECSAFLASDEPEDLHRVPLSEAKKAAAEVCIPSRTAGLEQDCWHERLSSRWHGRWRRVQAAAGALLSVTW